MEMFSRTEILLMIGVVGVLLIVIVVLTVFDIKDYLKNKNKEDLEEYEFGEELDNVQEEKEIPLEPVEVLEVSDNNEIMIADMEDVSENTLSYEPVKKIEDEVLIEDVEELPEIKENVLENFVEPKEDVMLMEVEEPKKDEKININEELSKALDSIKDEESVVIPSFEEEQERTAIISLDELMNRSDELYENNEVLQYDDGNEPISIDEIMSMYNKEEKSVPEVMKDIVEEKEVYTHKETTPFISSVYGIETNNSLEFENTATYEKLSRSKRTEFMAKLREMNENK